MLALFVSATAQEKKEEGVLDCTDPGVLTAEAVKLGAPVKLLWATPARGGSVTAAFSGASDKSIVFVYGGLASPTQFDVIYKCRFTANSFEWVEHKLFPADSKETLVLLAFVREWASQNLPEEKRAMLKGIPDAYIGPEFNRLSEEEKQLYGLTIMLDQLDKHWPAKKSR